MAAEPTNQTEQDANTVRRCSKWLIDQTWFDNVVLFLIVLNCTILALQTPIEGPAVACVLPTVPSEYDAAVHNCDTTAELNITLLHLTCKQHYLGCAMQATQM